MDVYRLEVESQVALARARLAAPRSDVSSPAGYKARANL